MVLYNERHDPHRTFRGRLQMPDTLTRKERLRRCFFHEETDRPGVFSRAGFPRSDPTYKELIAYIAEHTELKPNWWAGLNPHTDTESRTEPHTEDFDRRITVLHTPAGDLTNSYIVSRRGLPGMEESYFLKTPEDVETYLSLPEPAIDVDVDSFREAEKAVGDAGIVDVNLGANPGGFTAELFGSETFALMSVTHRDLIHTLCERRMNSMLKKVKRLVELGVGPYFSMLGEEFIVPPLHGPKDFDDFNVRYNKPIIDEIHNAGGRIHIHCHGSISVVFQGFLDMGVDVLHPFEPPPLGNITAAEAKSLARGKMCLEGNIQINRMYEASADELRAETEALIRDCWDDRRGLIVSPTASPYIRGLGEECFPQYKAMIDTVLNWKG